jgi:hypothetical protein
VAAIMGGIDLATSEKRFSATKAHVIPVAVINFSEIRGFG